MFGISFSEQQYSLFSTKKKKKIYDKHILSRYMRNYILIISLTKSKMKFALKIVSQ